MPATVLLVFHVERKRKRRSIGPDLGRRLSGCRWSVVVENKSVFFALFLCLMGRQLLCGTWWKKAHEQQCCREILVLASTPEGYGDWLFFIVYDSLFGLKKLIECRIYLLINCRKSNLFIHIYIWTANYP